MRTAVAVVVAMLVAGCGWIGVDRQDEHGMTALMYAARAGNLAEVERLIARGAGVNTRVPRRDLREFIAFLAWMQQLPKSDIGYTPLLYAVEGRNPAVIALLIRHGADVNHADFFGMTPMRLAVFRSDIPVMTMLADAGAKPSQHDLSIAIRQTSPDTVRLLLERGVSPHGPMPLPHRTYAGPRPPLLFLAIDRGDPEIVRLLLEAGVDVTLKDENGWTPLRRARQSRGDPGVIAQLLQQAGARDDGAAEEAVLAAARSKDPAALAEALQQQRGDPEARDRSGVTPLVIAARRGDTVAIETLLSAGADVNAATPHSGTALIAAAGNGHVAAIERLLAAGADVHARDSIKKTALYAAIERRHEDAARALLAAKANAGDGLLALAALRGSAVLVTLLLDHGADLKKEGLHALTEAARGGKDEIVLLLLERGADPRGRKGGDDATPLHRAASNCGPETVRALLARGADPNARESNGYTPLLHAAISGKLENVRALIVGRADVNARDDDGKTILQYAARHPEVQEALRHAGAR